MRAFGPAGGPNQSIEVGQIKLTKAPMRLIKRFPFRRAKQEARYTTFCPAGLDDSVGKIVLVAGSLMLCDGNMQGVLFYDMGNVYRIFSDIFFWFRQRDLQDVNYTVHLVGFGGCYRTPIGPIWGVLAYSLNPPSYLDFSGTAP